NRAFYFQFQGNCLTRDESSCISNFTVISKPVGGHYLDAICYLVEEELQHSFHMKYSLMKIVFLSFFTAAMLLLGQSSFSQDKNNKDTTELLGLPGDNLDLSAVMSLFPKSKTIEAFEKSLNDEKTGINNLDLNLDKKVDFIKVVTTKDGNAYMFTLKVDVTKTETQDVAVILLNKDKDNKVSLQMVGDEEL